MLFLLIYRKQTLFLFSFSPRIYMCFLYIYSKNTILPRLYFSIQVKQYFSYIQINAFSFLCFAPGFRDVYIYGIFLQGYFSIYIYIAQALLSFQFFPEVFLYMDNILYIAQIFPIYIYTILPIQTTFLFYLAQIFPYIQDISFFLYFAQKCVFSLYIFVFYLYSYFFFFICFVLVFSIYS